jgi:hypothetical protein
MRKLISILVISFITFQSHAQEGMEKAMEGRAKEFYKTLGKSDLEEYKKFMKENYTKSFLEKPVKVNRQTSGDGPQDDPSQNGSKTLSDLDARAKMFLQLHQDFGESKLVSLKRQENKMVMVLSATSGLTGTFTLTYEKNKPFLIEGLGVQAEMSN